MLFLPSIFLAHILLGWPQSATCAQKTVSLLEFKPLEKTKLDEQGRQASASSGKHQTADDVGSAVWRTTGSGWGGCGHFHGGFQGLQTGGSKAKDKEWIPVAKLSHLVKDMKIKFLEKIYPFSLPIGCIPKGWGSKDHASADADLGWPED